MLDDETLQQLEKARELHKVMKNIESRMMRIVEPLCEDAVASGDVERIKAIIDELPPGPYKSGLSSALDNMNTSRGRR